MFENVKMTNYPWIFLLFYIPYFFFINHTIIPKIVATVMLRIKNYT